MQLRLLALGLTAALLAACGPAGDPATDPGNPSNPEALQSASWILRQYDAGGALLDAVDRGGSLNFESDGSMPGSTGCNRFIGEWEADGQQLTLTIGPTTMMACSEALMAQESAVLAALPRTASYTVAEGVLTLLEGSGQPVAVYDQAPDDLAGTAWQATGINDGKGAVVSTLATESVTLLFDGEGGVSGYGGCADYTGLYRAEGQSILFSELAQDEQCEPSNGADLQAQFLAALSNSRSFRIDGARLDLRDDIGARQANFTELQVEKRATQSPSPSTTPQTP